MTTKRSEGLAIALFSVLIHAPLAAQAAAWTQVASTGPAARHSHSMAYDSQRGRTVLFGGRTPTAAYYGDTWEWNGSVWQAQLFTSHPSARAYHAMAYDSQRGRTVLFGGSGGNDLSDTWEWNGGTWTQVASTGPAARAGHAMAYDAQRGRTVLFGGYYYSGTTYYLSDTWEWNGSTWLLVATIGPSARGSHAMAYDSQRGRTVLFGGSASGVGSFADTWEWNGGTWTLVATTGLYPCSCAMMAYDSQRRRTVLFGLRETWEWNGSIWTQVATTGSSAQGSHAMAYDSQRGRTVLFGGHGTSGTLGDTWEWNGGFSSTAATFGTGCGTPALVLSASAPPTINTTAQAAATNIPSSIAFVALGWSRTAFGPFQLPLTLAGFGMPGCDLLQSAEFAWLPVTFTGPSTATFSLSVPNDSGLIGLHVYLQGYAFAPGANPAEIIVSNGLDWGIGNL